MNIGMYQMYLKLMIDGVGSAPFSATGMPPFPEPIISYKSEIIESSRENFSKPRAEVEEIIKKWNEEGRVVGKGPHAKENIAKNTSPLPSFNQKTTPPVSFSRPPFIPNNMKMVDKNIQTKAPIIAQEIKKHESFVPVLKKPEHIIQNKYNHGLPPIENDASDDFLPLKDLAKKILVEPNKVFPAKLDSNLTGEEKQVVSSVANGKNAEKSYSKVNNSGHLDDLRSALQSVIKKNETKKVQNPIFKKEINPKKEEKEENPSILPGASKKSDDVNTKNTHSINQSKEISEEDLKKVFGI